MRLFSFLIFTFAVILGSCRNENSDKMQVNGMVKNNPGPQTVFLEVVEADIPAPRTLDTAMIEKGDGDFYLAGLSGKGENMYRLKFSNGDIYVLLVDDRKDISFFGDWDNLRAFTTNSPATNSLHDLLTGFNTNILVIDSLRQIILGSQSVNRDDSLVSVNENLFKDVVIKTENFLLQYADTAKSHTVALYALGLGKSQISTEKLEPVMTNLARRFPNSQEVIRTTTDFFNMIHKAEQGNLTGKVAPEISLPDPDGKIISLSSLRGKYVLVDFWASWCMPCRAENPNIVENFNLFKDKNFTILGVSLDRDKSSWLKAIQDDKLDWSQISDLKYWNSVVVPQYSIEGIPFNVLVDPEGKIIASNLRGAKLKQTLQELLN